MFNQLRFFSKYLFYIRILTFLYEVYLFLRVVTLDIALGAKLKVPISRSVISVGSDQVMDVTAANRKFMSVLFIAIKKVYFVYSV